MLHPIQRKAAIGRMLQELEVLEKPGIRAIKQVELYTKWRKIVPLEYRDITCPRPNEEIMKKVKDDKANKAKGKKRKAAQDSLEHDL